MDRLVVEKEIETKKEVQTEILINTESKTDSQNKKQLQEKPISYEPLPEIETGTQNKTGYLSSLENITIADFRKQEEDKRVADFESKKDELIAQQYTQFENEEEVLEEIQQPVQNIIEKPNYDLIEENKKVIKLKQKSVTKKKPRKKLASIAIACALGAGAIIAVTNCVIIDNMNASYIQIDETYKLNLSKYLKNINKIDQAQQGMEFIETYPEELLDAGDTGKKSNWFDRICNFIAGLFGG